MQVSLDGPALGLPSPRFLRIPCSEFFSIPTCRTDMFACCSGVTSQNASWRGQTAFVVVVRKRGEFAMYALLLGPLRSAKMGSSEVRRGLQRVSQPFQARPLTLRPV